MVLVLALVIALVFAGCSNAPCGNNCDIWSSDACCDDDCPSNLILDCDCQ
jgi:hypothetical protein